MAVLFVSHKYPPSVGGMEKQSFELIKGYNNMANSFSLVHEGKESIVLFFLFLRKRIQQILLQYPEINVIHLNDGLMAAAFALLANPKGRKVAVTFHGLDVVFPLRIYQKYILPKVKKFDAFICVSTATKEECAARSFDANKLFVVVNGVDVTATNHQATIEIKEEVKQKYNIQIGTDIILLGIGRPVRRKGFSWFATEVLPTLPVAYKYVHVGNVDLPKKSIFDILPERIKKMLQLFLGSTNDAQNLVNLTKNPTYKNRLVLTGRVSDKVRDYLIAEAALVIMPNIKDPGDMEGFGLVALEASVQGKKVLAAGIEGITDAIHHNKNGYLTTTQSVEEWRDNIISLTAKTNTFDQGIKDYTIQHFSWQNMVARYAKIFADLTSRA